MTTLPQPPTQKQDAIHPQERRNRHIAPGQGVPAAHIAEPLPPHPPPRGGDVAHVRRQQRQQVLPDDRGFRRGAQDPHPQQGEQAVQVAELVG